MTYCGKVDVTKCNAHPSLLQTLYCLYYEILDFHDTRVYKVYGNCHAWPLNEMSDFIRLLPKIKASSCANAHPD